MDRTPLGYITLVDAVCRLVEQTSQGFTVERGSDGSIVGPISGEERPRTGLLYENPVPAVIDGLIETAVARIMVAIDNQKLTVIVLDENTHREFRISGHDFRAASNEARDSAFLMGEIFALHGDSMFRYRGRVSFVNEDQFTGWLAKQNVTDSSESPERVIRPGPGRPISKTDEVPQRRPANPDDDVAHLHYARELLSSRGYGPSIEDSTSFGKGRSLSRDWVRESRRSLPDELKRKRGSGAPREGHNR